MILPRRELLRLAACAAALPGVPHAAWAQAYPARPIRAVVPFAPGGTTDTFARLMALKLTQQLGKQVYVENIPGATGNIGTGQVAKSAPDGYTILFAFSSHVVNPTLFARLPYDPVNDFKPVTLAVASTTVLTVNPAVPAKTVKELVELIKANPGKYSFSSAGAGTQADLAGEQFRANWPRSRSHPVRRRRACGRGGGCGPHANQLQLSAGRHAGRQGRDRARSRGHQQDALATLSRRTDHDGGGLPGH